MSNEENMEKESAILLEQCVKKEINHQQIIVKYQILIHSNFLTELKSFPNRRDWHDELTWRDRSENFPIETEDLFPFILSNIN